MERYGQRMNQLLKFDETTSQQQLGTIQDYQPHIAEFKAFIEIISNELERIHVPLVFCMVVMMMPFIKIVPIIFLIILIVITKI